MERVYQVCFSIPGDRFAVVPPDDGISFSRSESDAAQYRPEIGHSISLATFTSMGDSSQLASFPALPCSWLATLARKAEEV
jgi:hypothetical protein